MLPGKGDLGNTDNSKLDSGIKKMFFIFHRAWDKETICFQLNRSFRIARHGWDGLRDLNLLFAAVEEAAEEEAYSTLMNEGGKFLKKLCCCVCERV